jgi:translation initiation factor IF-3
MFRGREMVHAERGLVILDRLADELKDLALIETEPKLEGRNMHMLLGPIKKEPTKAEKEKAKAEAKAEARAEVDAEAATKAAATAKETKE